MRNSWSPRLVALVVLSVFSLSDVAFGRMRWPERDGLPVLLHPRRFGQEHPPVIQKLSAACEGQVCGVLAGAAITPLLALQGECTQQDMADRIIDESKQFDAATQANMLALAKEYRQAEKNTPPDFTTNPPKNRNSVFCQKAPAHPELNNLVQAQDPANDANAFFDPAKSQATVLKGSQPNTEPFQVKNGNAAVSSQNDPVCQAPASGGTSSVSPTPTPSTPANPGNTPTPSGSAPQQGGSTQQQTSSTDSSGADFGSCSKPQVEFKTGLDGRKETAFGAVDLASYNHGSAQNIHVLTDFMCLALTNTCKANQAAKDLCAKAEAAADATTPPKSGAQADVFNSFFGFTTKFADVTPVSP